ncbi:MAG: T9SS type A sorting domain-containing protein [Bacteroidota bacterium]
MQRNLVYIVLIIHRKIKMKYIAIIFILCCTVTVHFGQCIEDGHSPFQHQGWESCQTSISPVGNYGDVHWLQYDLGQIYALNQIHLWNHNVWGEIGKGVKEIYIDYSANGQNWVSTGLIEVPQAPGSWKYQGAALIDLQNITARYVHFAVASTWGGGECAGIGEIRFGLGSSVSTGDITPQDPSLTISPNPASETIFIRFSHPDNIQQLNILDINGRSVFYTAAYSQNMEIDIRLLPPGMYFVQTIGKDGVQVEPFLAKRW